MKKLWIGVLFWCGALWAESAKPETPVITSFPEKFFLQLITRYNYASFSGESTDDVELQTNLPIELGVGGGYGIFSWSSLLSFSFGSDEDRPRTKGTNLQLGFYGNRFFGEAILIADDGFYSKEQNGDQILSYNLFVMELALKLNYLWNPEHSLRAFYSMDRRQWVNNGSFICGLGAYYHGIESKDSVMAYYSERQSFLHAGPSVGYSYNWVWDSGMFLNLMATGSTTVGKNVTRDKWMVFFQFFPQAVLGYHSDTWSVNFPFAINFLHLSDQSGKISDVLLKASGGMTLTKRF